MNVIAKSILSIDNVGYGYFSASHSTDSVFPFKSEIQEHHSHFFSGLQPNIKYQGASRSSFFVKPFEYGSIFALRNSGYDDFNTLRLQQMWGAYEKLILWKKMEKTIYLNVNMPNLKDYALVPVSKCAEVEKKDESLTIFLRLGSTDCIP